MNGEQGYAQGRLIVDIGSFLFGLGELKGIMNSWKRLKKIDLTGVLSKLKKPEQKLIKTENIKYIDDAFAMVEEHAPKNLPEAIAYPHKTQKTPTGVEIKSKTLSMNNMPGEFTPLGNSAGYTSKNIKDQIVRELNTGDPKIAEKVLSDIMNSAEGATKMSILTKQITLYKIVPKGVVPSSYTPFWSTENEIRNIVRSGRLEQYLGLPKGSTSGVYELYKITLKPEFLKEKTPIFVSKIAPTMEGGYYTTGGGKQIIVPNRDKWTNAEKVLEFNFNK